ncbi:DNA-binding protein [Dactylosporangium sp. NPDC005572]|uniref:DNA-binding protein n=1 Tax=Dactylosporangium sp. NPDC005572 TaxID=3156889 RepID=UPI0033A02AA6
MKALSRKELLALPAVVGLVTAAHAMGIGRTRAFELVRRGDFPVPVLRVGVTYRVPTAGLLRLLGLAPGGDPELKQAS